MRRAYIPTDVEMQQLLETHSSPRTQLALMLSHLGGLRVSEVALASIGDVVNMDGSLKHAIQVYGKGGKWRNVPLSDKLKGFIQAALPHSYDLGMPLVPTRLGEHWNASSLSHHFTLWYAAAGLHEATGNSGRRAFMTRLHRQKTPIKIICQLAGHTSISVTQAYLDVGDDELRDAVNSL